MHSSLYTEQAALAKRQAQYLAEQEEERGLAASRKVETARALARPIGVWQIAAGVFLGNLGIGILAAIFYALSRT